MSVDQYFRSRVNYYPHHIGDYLRDTSHLTALEDGIYRRMLDLYYASEKPLGLDVAWLCRLVRAISDDEKASVEFVLQHFFEKFEDGWHNKRADEEIKLNEKRIKVAKVNGKKGGRPKTQRVISRLAVGTQRDISGLAKRNPNESSQNQNQNQNQEGSSAQRSRGSRLPTDWRPSQLLFAWASKERPDLELEVTIAKFRDYWTSKPGRAGTKLDWDATFRNWVREEKPGRQHQRIQVDL